MPGGAVGAPRGNPKLPVVQRADPAVAEGDKGVI